MAFEERGQSNNVLSGTSTGFRLLDYVVEKIEVWLLQKPTVHHKSPMIQMPSSVVSDIDLEALRSAVGPYQMEEPEGVHYAKVQLSSEMIEPKSKAPAHHTEEPVFIRITARKKNVIAIARRDSDAFETRFQLDTHSGGLDVSALNSVVIALDIKAAALLETPLAIKRASTPQSVVFPMPSNDIADPRGFFILGDQEVATYEDQLALQKVIHRAKGQECERFVVETEK